MGRHKQKAVLPITALVAAFMLFGVNTPLIKLGVESIPVSIFMSIRFVTAALVFLPLAIRTWKPLRLKDALVVCLGSIIGISVSSLALNVGLAKTTSMNASVIWLLGPLILLLLSAGVLKERINPKTFIGIMVALLGSVIIIGRARGGGMSLPDELTGNLLVVVAVFCDVLVTIIMKSLLKKMSTYQAVFLSFFPGIVPVLIYALTQLPSWHITNTTSRSLEAMIASTVMIVAGNFFFFYALRYKEAQSTGAYRYLDSVTALMASWFLLGERLTAVFALGTILIFVGIYLSEAHVANHPKLKQRVT